MDENVHPATKTHLLSWLKERPAEPIGGPLPRLLALCHPDHVLR